MLIGLIAGLGSGLVFGVAAAVQAAAVRGFDGASGTLRGFLRRAVTSPALLGVVAAYLLGFGLHAVAIWLLPLYLAQSTIAVQMPITALGAAWMLQERLRWLQWAAIAAVAGGIVLLALGAGAAGTSTSRPALTLALVLLVPTILLLPRRLLRHRASGPAPGRTALVGALAGLGYAGSALAVRGIEWPLTGSVLLAALLVPGLSVVAFWLYSAALDRTEVASATAALIVLQTAAPTVVGLVWLGDAVASTPLVVTGLLLATGGAVLTTPGAPAGPARTGPARTGPGRPQS